MVKLASSYNNLLDLNTEIEQAAQQPDQFHTADTHYDAVAKTLPAVEENPSEIEISDVEKTLDQLDKIQEEAATSQENMNKTQQDDTMQLDQSDASDDVDDNHQVEISDDPNDALDADKTTSLDAVLGNVANQRNSQSNIDSTEQKQDNAMTRIRNQFGAKSTTPVKRDVETFGHGIDQQKVTPIDQPQINYSFGSKSLAMGTQSLSMLSTEDFDQQVDQLTQGIEKEAEELTPVTAKVMIDGSDLTDDLPATIAGTYSITRNDDQNIVITKTAELPDTTQLEQKISELQQKLASSADETNQLQADKKQLLSQIKQLQSQADHLSDTADDNPSARAELKSDNSQTIDKRSKSTPASEISAALVKVRENLNASATPIKQVDQIDQPSAEFVLTSSHALMSNSDRGEVIQQLMGSSPDSKFSRELRHADKIAVQVQTTQTNIKPSLGSLSLLALTQARSQINVQFSQKDRKNNA